MAHLLKKNGYNDEAKTHKVFCTYPWNRNLTECCHDHGSCDDKAKL